MQSPLTHFLSIGFRPFFWLGGAYAVYLGIVWGAILGGHWAWQSSLPMMFWHAHEFIFGFVMAIIIGFLTTAVQNWTGLKSIRGLPLGLLVLLWIAGRIAFNSGTANLGWLLWPDLLLILATAGVVGALVLRAKNTPNLVFIPLLLLFGGLHIMQMSALHHQDFAGLRQWEITSVWLVTFLIGLVGTRVIPFFTEKKLGVSVPREDPKLTLFNQSVLAMVAMAEVLNWSTGLSWSTTITQLLLAFALLGNVHRLVRWHRRGIWREPMLWSLWLGYACLPLTFGLLLIHGQSGYMHALHLLTVGAIAGIILAMINRVSLGHSGRVIAASRIITLSFILIYASALSRSLGSLIVPEWSPIWWGVSLACWVGAFGIFVARFTHVMWTPRPDGN